MSFDITKLRARNPDIRMRQSAVFVRKPLIRAKAPTSPSSAPAPR